MHHRKGANNIFPIEIKARKTMSNNFFDGLLDWKKISQQENIESYVVYGGKDSVKREKGHIFSWKNLEQMLQLIYHQ